MNISVAGPEGSGKTTFLFNHAKQAAYGRPVYYIGKLKTPFIPMHLEDYNTVKNAVVIMDDVNALVDSYDLRTKDKRYKEPIAMNRHYNRLNMFAFHGLDDSVKYFLRQSKVVYVSTRYQDVTYQKKFLNGIIPGIIGKEPYAFYKFKRY